ncbi:MAG: ribonuclease III [Clostridia bacterium]|nr:ribonuclease III [Clostridia bacterium]
MERFLSEKQVDPRQLSPLTLAFIGDTVYDLLVREEIICDANRSANDLHALAVKQVKASAQAQAITAIMPELTEEELTIFKRGRNAKTAHIAKNASTCDYHKATGLEAVIGYLYLSGNLQRIKELYNLIRSTEKND